MMMDRELEREYSKRFVNTLVDLAQRLELHLADTLKDCPRIDRISARAKSVSRFMTKARRIENGLRKYMDPLNQIQDQLGARVVVFYLMDVDTVSRVIEDYYSPIEAIKIVPDSESEFGYEGKHYILFIPDDILPTDLAPEHRPKFFELQIKTLFQHAWSEAGHDLAYKPQNQLSVDDRRKVAFTAAQAWGADQIFNELVTEILPNEALRDDTTGVS